MSWCRQLVNDPPAGARRRGPRTRRGIWLALGGAVLMTVGALVRRRARAISLAVDGRRRDADHANGRGADLE